MRKIVIFFGGKSSENEISVLTGVFVLNLIDREKYIPVPVYLHTDGGMYTSGKMSDLNTFRKGGVSGFQRVFFDGGGMYAFTPGKPKIKLLGKPDGALNCCHGGLGEGGCRTQRGLCPRQGLYRTCGLRQHGRGPAVTDKDLPADK